MILFFTIASLLLSALATIGIFIGLIGHNIKIRKISVFFMGVAFIFVSIFFIITLLNSEMLNTRLWYLIPMNWALLLISFLAYFWFKHDIFFLAAAPISFVILFSYIIFNQNQTVMNDTLSGPIFWIHLISVFLGIGLMALAACAGIIFLWQERALKKKVKLSSQPKNLPALASLDKVNALATGFGFPIYSLGVLSGFAWAYLAWGSVFSFDPKEIVSLFVLGLYAYLFHQRQAHSASGKKPALLAIYIFAASLISIVFVNTLLPSHHNF